MPVVVVAAGIAAYQYYEYKRRNSRFTLAGGGGDDDGEKDATKTASADVCSKVEARDDDYSAEKGTEATIDHSDDDKTEESSSGSFDDDSSDCPANNGGANTQAKPPTLLQQWNEKYPHLATHPHNGQHTSRNLWGDVLKKRFDEWRMAPSPSSSAAVAAPPSVGSGAKGAVYSEVWLALALRDGSPQENEKEKEEPRQQSRAESSVAPPVSLLVAKPRPDPDSTVELPRTAVARLEALRRNFFDRRNPQPPPEEEANAKVLQEQLKHHHDAF